MYYSDPNVFTSQDFGRIGMDMQYTARFRFHFSLNDFLAPAQRDTWVTYSFDGAPAVKDAIEAIGVPHTEVDVVLVNCKPRHYNYKLQPNDEVEIYPASVHTMWPSAVTLLLKTPDDPAFIVDVHLGKLARLLRLLGFDTLFDESLTEKKLVAIAVGQNRILLSRGVGIFKHKTIKHGYWLRSQQPEEQLREVVSYYKLAEKIEPFTRCMACNGTIDPVEKETIAEQLLPKTRLYFDEFYQCRNCKRVYWKGSHYNHMQELISSIAKL